MTDKKKILLVEDEPNLAFNVEFNLQAEGYDVVLAQDGKQALEAYRNQGPFALIILDIMIPEINGFECCRRLRDLVSGEELPILMVTALYDVKSVEQAFAPLRRTTSKRWLQLEHRPACCLFVLQ